MAEAVEGPRSGLLVSKPRPWQNLRSVAVPGPWIRFIVASPSCRTWPPLQRPGRDPGRRVDHGKRVADHLGRARRVVVTATAQPSSTAPAVRKPSAYRLDQLRTELAGRPTADQDKLSSAGLPRRTVAVTRWEQRRGRLKEKRHRVRTPCQPPGRRSRKASLREGGTALLHAPEDVVEDLINELDGDSPPGAQVVHSALSPRCTGSLATPATMRASVWSSAGRWGTPRP